MIKPLLRKIKRRFYSGAQSNTDRFDFFEIGFHGDQYLLKLVDVLMHKSNHFIETGANVGSTLYYVAHTYPHLQCLSCEPDKEAFNRAVENTSHLSNVSIFNETSQSFLRRLELQYERLLEASVVFWLDAHGYGFEWPLKEELSFVTRRFKSAHILIDDFKVPGLDYFGYDVYQGQVCSYEYIKEALNSEIQYKLYYPAYAEKTSRHHPLRGWGLIVFGYEDELDLPEFLQSKIHRVM